MPKATDTSTDLRQTETALREISLAAELDARRYAIYIEEDTR